MSALPRPHPSDFDLPRLPDTGPLSLNPVAAAQPAPAPAQPFSPLEHESAGASEDSRRSFLRMVSHELRTPLNAIIGFSEIISAEICGPISPQYREYGEIIRVSGHRMLRLVNQVLEIVKLEGGSMELDPRAELLDVVFSDAIKASAEDLTSRGVTVDIQLPAPCPAALGDAKALRSAVANLLQNAAVYAPEGSSVRLIGRVRGPLVQIAVEDDGEGLDPAELPRLMRPFEQGENALVRRTEGAGLGWPLVLLNCQAMGGRFEVETAPGQGLKAVISLRRAG